VAENVKGIRTLGDGMILEAIIADFKDRGYVLSVRMMRMHQTNGVPQDREASIS
jgi:DNA (cytosine-5)-methyltransferase 1